MSKAKLLRTTKHHAKPMASLSAQALNRKPEADDVNDEAKAAVAISGVTLVEGRAEAFVKQWSDRTMDDIEAGWIADESRRRNCLDLLFDMTEDYKDNPSGLMELPAPYTEAPKGMTPFKWNAERKNEPWPFDKWSERVTQSQGGKRNVNYSFYLIAVDKSEHGVSINKQITTLKDAIVNYGKTALTGDLQGLDKDQLQTRLNMWEARRTTAGENIRKAIGLHRQLNAFETYRTKIVSQGKGPWKYPEFSIATESVTEDGSTYDVPSASKKPIRFGIVELTRDANNKEREATTYKPPISVDTFLNYDVDLFAHAMSAPGADVYNAVVESASVGSEENKVKQIKLPFSTESWIAVQGLSASFIEVDDNRAAVIKRLVKKDAQGKFENEAEIKSVVDQYLEMMPVIQVLKPIYNKLVLSDVQAAKLENADKLATN